MFLREKEFWDVYEITAPIVQRFQTEFLQKIIEDFSNTAWIASEI